MTPCGYHSRCLRVDLADGGAEYLPLEEGLLRRTIGGVGLGTALLLRESPAGIDARAPEAAVVFALGPLVGTPLTTSAKFAVVSKSPLTNRINDALASDRFALDLKACGVDALVLRGRAPVWSLLVVEEGTVHLEPATGLVGLPAAAAEADVKTRLGPDFRFFGIGPAGENGVRYATASTRGRHAGRGGLGAVLGAKRLKGIAVKGTLPTTLADADAVLALAQDLSARALGEGTAKYRELGTVANVLVLNRLGALPTRNFRTGAFEGAEAVSGEALHELEGRVRRHCAACTIGCEHVFPLKDADGRGVRVEYEALFSLGPMLGIDDRDAVLEAAAACDDLGLDVISAGGTIAFAMECGERGLLEGAPTFGDAAGALALLHDIAHRRGLGDLLAEGSRRTAARLGQGAEHFACHVKGLELPGYDPRALPALALGLAVGTRGADHNRSGAYEIDLSPEGARLETDEAMAVAVARTEDRAALLDSLVLCKFLRGALDDVVEEAARMLAAVTGWDVTKAELEATARRIVDAKKTFNEREGWTNAEDTLPPRLLEEPLAGGAAAGATLTADALARQVSAYYRARGWTGEGLVSATD